MSSRRFLGWVSMAVLCVGCAKGILDEDGGNSGNPDAPIGGNPDAPVGGNPDAPVGGNPDAMPMTRTLTQTSSDTMVSGNSVSCNQTDGLGVQTHDDNSYFRIFDLPGSGINSAFNVTQVTVGIETAVGGIGSQPATVRLYRLNGTPSLANLTQIASTNVTVPDQDLTLLNVNITGTAPAGSKLAVEFFTPAGHTDGNNIFIGSNTSGETAPVYLVAAACSITDLTAWSALGVSVLTMHAIIKVTGTYNP